MKADHARLIRTWQQRARGQMREIAMTSVLTLVALGFVLAALFAPPARGPSETGALPEHLDRR